MSPPNVTSSAVSFISFILVCIPLPWHLQAWNTGTCLYMIWTAIGTLDVFVNSVIYKDNTNNSVPVWCDISTKLFVGVAVGTPAAALCICRRMYYVAAIKTVTITRRDKRRAITVDLAICLVPSFLVMALHYVVQDHRFDIYEEIGCVASIYNTALAYIIFFSPLLLISLISGRYAILCIIEFKRRHSSAMENLANTPGLTSSLYFRFMVLAGIEIIVGVPLCVALIIINSTQSTVYPWISWADTHWHFSRVDHYPMIVWKSDPIWNARMELTRWMIVVCAFKFFAFFGFADEARRSYKMALCFLAKRVGYTSKTMQEWDKLRNP